MMETPTSRRADVAPHVLYVAWGYPPSRGPGMYRALATSNMLAALGFRVTVLTTTRETFDRLTGSDPESETFIDPRIEVVRIPFDPVGGESDIRRWSALRVWSPLLWGFMHSQLSRVQFPEATYGTWRRDLVAAAKRIHAADPVDLVIGTANPNVDFAPGWHLWRRHGIPFVMDYRDAWHLNVYTGHTVGSALSRSQRLERRLLDSAHEVWFVNEPIRDWHAARHPQRADRFHVVANGFDARFLDELDRAPRDDRDALIFGYLGTIYGPIPLKETLEGWRIARERSPLVAASRLVFRGRLGHFREPDAQAAELLGAYRSHGVTYEGPVSKSQVSEVYAGFDALLLILSHSRYVTSGKVYEYAATGLPIAALHHPETAATQVLADHPSCFPVAEPTPGAIADAIIATAEAAAQQNSEDRRRVRAWASRLSREGQLTPRIEALLESVTAKRGGPR